jgi:hypothetical protein
LRTNCVLVPWFLSPKSSKETVANHANLPN